MTAVRRSYRFAVLPEWVLLHPDLSGNAKVMYGVLDRHTDKEHQAWPSHDRLADLLNRSRAAVKRDLAELEAVGAILVEPRFDDTGRQSSNRYLLAGDHPLTPGRSDMTPPEGVTDDPGEGVRDEPQTRAIKNESHLNEIAATSAAENPSHSLTLIKDALVGVFGEPKQPTGWGLYNRVATMIRDDGCGPADVLERAGLLATEWGHKAATVAALEKHWGRYAPGKVGRLSQAQVDAFTREQERHARSQARQTAIEQVYGSDR